MSFSKVHPACHNILQTVSNQEIILKRLIRMLPIIQKLYVGAYGDICEMHKLFIQQCGQMYPSPFLFIQEKSMQVRAFERYIPFELCG